MSIIHVEHCRPVSYLTPSGYHAFAILPVTTPVRLREADPRDFEWVATLPTGGGEHRVTFHAHEGRLWNRLQTFDYFRPDGDKWHPLARDQFLAEIQKGAGQRTETLWNSLSQYLHRTPLEMVRGYHNPPRRPIEDGAAVASQALSAYVESSIRLVGDHVYVRALGPLAEREDQKAVKGYDIVPLPGWGGGRLMIRADRVEELWRFEREQEPFKTRKGPDRFPGFRNPVDPALLGDDDIEVFVRSLPGGVLNHATQWDREQGGIYAEPGMAPLLDEMASWHLRGYVGGIPADRQEEVLTLACRIADRLREISDIRPERRFRDRIAYAERIALPRVRGRALVAEEDADAFLGLGIGGP